MDAIIRNKCEDELLLLIKEISNIFEIELNVESEALLEGGLKETWRFVGKNSGQIAILISIAALILSRYPPKNNELENLQIENAKLERVERQLRIEKLKKELKDSPDTVEYEELTSVLHNDLKITKRISNFYHRIDNYPKITKLSTKTLTIDNRTIEEYFVDKKDFSHFVFETNELPDYTDENATIEIISPVLKTGKYKWKGIYNKTGIKIEFSMKDKNFKKDVINSKVQFQNGTCIDCVLTINQKIDDSGEIIYAGFSVLTVLNVHEESISFETPQGKRYRQKKEADKKQLKLKFG